MIIKRFINNIRDGYHVSSAYWQNWKKAQPHLNTTLMEIAIAMVLSDATMYRVSREAYIKFEQGYLQKDFLFHLFELFKGYCFMLQPGARIPKLGHRKNEVKSYWFKTFSHQAFTQIWELFYSNKVKKILPGLVTNYMTGLGLAYWIISDGSLAKDSQSMILHTQSYTFEENTMLSHELNKSSDYILVWSYTSTNII
jgi:LAGLIDADG DNA endonuclease family